MNRALPCRTKPIFYRVVPCTNRSLGSLPFGFDVAIIAGAGPFLAQPFVLNDLSSAAALQLSVFRLRIEEFENTDRSVLADLNAKAHGRLGRKIKAPRR